MHLYELGIPFGSKAPFHKDVHLHADRANLSYKALAVAIAISCPRLLTGVDINSSQDDKDMVTGILTLYVHLFMTFAFSGYRAMVDSVKCIANWSLFYATRSSGVRPALIGHLLGANAVEGTLAYPWARGELGTLIYAPIVLGKDTKSSQALFQIYLSRKALAVPEPAKLEKALHQHYLDYTSVGEYPTMGTWAKSFAEAWAKKLTKKDVSFLEISLKYGRNASLTSPKGRGGKQRDGLIDVKPYQDSYIMVPKTGTMLYSFFGEEKVHSDLLSLIEHFQGDHENLFRFPVKWLYLSLVDYQKGMTNEQYIVRDVALSKCYNVGLINWDSNVPVGLIGQDPFLSVFTEKMTYRQMGLDFDQPPFPHFVREVEIHGLKERGDKCRPININEWYIALLGGPVREYMYKLASGDPEIPTLHDRKKGGLTSFRARVLTHLKARFGKRVEEQLTPEEQEVLAEFELLSLDLSRCSDLILKELHLGFMLGTYAGSRASQNPFLRMVWMINSGHRKIIYRDSDLEDIEQCNLKPMMGDPPTWFIDNAYTKFIEHLAYYLCDKGIDITHLKTMDDMEQFLKTLDIPDWEFESTMAVRCGDDSITLGLRKYLDTVVLLYPLFGAIISPGSNTISKLSCIYCEQQMEMFDLPASLSDLLEFVDLLKIKALVSLEGDRFFDQSGIPPMWIRGVVAQSALSWFHEVHPKRQFVERYMLVEHGQTFLQMEKVGMLPRLPCNLGGLDYPSTKQNAWSHSGKQTKSVIKLLANLSLKENTLNAPYLSLMKQLQRLSSLYVVADNMSSYSENDSIEMDQCLDRLIERGHVLTYSEMKMQTKLPQGDYMIDFWPRMDNPFDVPGIDGKWLSFSKCMKRIRTTLILNRGLYTLSLDEMESVKYPTYWQCGIATGAIYEKIAAIFEDIDFPDEVDPLHGEYIRRAKESVTELTENVFLNYTSVEELVKKLSKPILLII